MEGLQEKDTTASTLTGISSGITYKDIHTLI